jgi:hypothetical protein
MTLGIATGKEVSKSSVFFFHTLKDTAFSLFSRFKIQQTLKINGNVFIRPNYGRFNFAKI